MKMLLVVFAIMPLAAQVEPTATAPDARLSGFVELGYRGLTGVGGSLDSYRSVVNLRSGPSLTSADVTLLDPHRWLFERLRIRVDNWGEPWSSLNLFAEKRGTYKLTVDLRSLTYFNNLPSYADPTIGRGITLDQQSFDLKRRTGTYALDLLTNRRVSPYVSVEHDAGSGHGVTVFQTDTDEFAVPATLRDSTDVYRAGTHISGTGFHITLEAGGTVFKSDQSTPALNLMQAYRIRGSGVFTRAVVNASPFRWLDVSGHFLFGQPRNSLSYGPNDAAEAKLPHTTGNAGVEIRPAHGLRVLESWTTDRLHNAGSAQQFIQSALANTYSQTETTVIADASRTVTLRAAYRFVRANANDSVFPLEGLPAVSAEKLNRNVGLGAIIWRPHAKLSLTAELEAGSSTGAYFRTSLYNYTKVRSVARYQALNTLRLSADYNVLSNRNPNAGSSYQYFSHQETLAVDWNPKGDRFTFDGSYSHCAYHSEIGYLVPQILTTAISVYRENCHTVSAYMNGSMHGFVKGSVMQFTAGGSAVLTSGSRPTTYYQPQAKLTVPVTARAGLFAEWRYYGLGESFYGYESFRAHLVIAGIRYSR